MKLSIGRITTADAATGDTGLRNETDVEQDILASTLAAKEIPEGIVKQKSCSPTEFPA